VKASGGVNGCKHRYDSLEPAREHPDQGRVAMRLLGLDPRASWEQTPRSPVPIRATMWLLELDPRAFWEQAPRSPVRKMSRMVKAWHMSL